VFSSHSVKEYNDPCNAIIFASRKGTAVRPEGPSSNSHDREVVIGDARSKEEIRRTGMNLAPCRSFGPLSINWGLVPRPHGRGYYIAALRAGVPGNPRSGCQHKVSHRSRVARPGTPPWGVSPSYVLGREATPAERATADRHRKRFRIHPLAIARGSVSLLPALIDLEAAIGIEPMNKGFADLCLTTWLRRPNAGIKR
jgi:hypothetical protein